MLRRHRELALTTNNRPTTNSSRVVGCCDDYCHACVSSEQWIACVCAGEKLPLVPVTDATACLPKCVCSESTLSCASRPAHDISLEEFDDEDLSEITDDCGIGLNYDSDPYEKVRMISRRESYLLSHLLPFHESFS